MGFKAHDQVIGDQLVNNVICRKGFRKSKRMCPGYRKRLSELVHYIQDIYSYIYITIYIVHYIH